MVDKESRQYKYNLMMISSYPMLDKTTRLMSEKQIVESGASIGSEISDIGTYFGHDTSTPSEGHYFTIVTEDEH